MHLSFAEPAAPILPYVSVYYLFEEDRPLIDDSQRADCGHLRLFLEGDGHQNLPNGTRIQSSPVMLLGPHSVASRFTVRGPLRFVGCSLKPRAWGGGLLTFEADDLLDGGCDGSAGLKGQNEVLTARLKECETITEMAPILDHYFTGLIRPLPPEHDAVVEAIRAWLKADIFPDVEALYAVCKPSERQVARISNRYWGAPPKSLARKYGALRTASHILNHAGAVPEAARHHYADHSHLIREIKRVTGMTPRQLNTISNMILRITLDEQHFRELQPL